MNPIILLTSALQVMNNYGSCYIRVDNAGKGFKHDSVDLIINDMNNSAGQIAGGDDAINFKRIGGTSVEDFITRLKNELHAHNHINIDVLNQITETLLSNWNNKQDRINYTTLNVAQKGQPDGYAPLNSETKVPNEFLPNDYLQGRKFVSVTTIQERDALPNITENMIVLVNEVDVPDPNDPGQTIKAPVLYYCKSITPAPVWIP